jgi:hypothetical protein
VVLSVTNLAGRPAVQGVALSAWLPQGVEVWSTDAVELSGGASRPGGRDPAPPADAPEWAGFELPGGATAVVRATLGFPAVDPGALQVTASASGGGPTGPTSVAGPQPAEYLLGTVATYRSPTGVRSGLSGVGQTWPFATAALATVPVGPTFTAASPSRLLPPEATAMNPSPGGARVGLVLASTVPSAQVCLFAEVVDVGTGAPVSTGGALGDAASPGACVGAATSTVELEEPSRPWSAQALGQVAVRWHLWSPQGAAARVEAAWFTFDWQDTSWSAPATVVSGQLPGGDRREPLATADGIALDLGGLPRVADPARALDLATPLPLAGDAGADAPAAVVVWRAANGGRVCLRVQWTVDGAPVGSPSTGVCRSAGSWSTDRFTPGDVPEADLGRLGVRLLPESQKPTARVEVDAVEVGVTWWRR